MSVNGKHLYRFGEFSLDTEQNVLLHDSKPLALTPKMLELLLILVKNPGRILEKDELIEAIWANSFVEEGNLKFTINQLRKALGDDARHPVYIETVARRGYRFIAEVVEITPDNNKTESLPASVFNPRKSSSFYPLFAVIAVIAVISFSAVALGMWLIRSRNTQPSAPILSADFSSEALSTNGKVFHAVISPDGKNVVYTNGNRDKISVWLRQLETGNNIEIIPPSDNRYFGLTISPDNNFLYFVRQLKDAGQFPILYRVPIFGGIPQEITNTTEGWISLSPDSARISFVRCPRSQEENCSLWIADSVNGKNERKIASRLRPFRISDNRISPDGKSIAFAVGQSENQANEFSLMEIDLESGTEKEISKEKFFNIKNLVWLPDKSGLLITARKNTERNERIWQVSVTTGETVPLTNDSETYSKLDLDKDATKLVSTQVKQNARLQLINAENPSIQRNLAEASSASFAPDGKIYFSSIMSGNGEIWGINDDGSGRRQLTNNASDESAVVVSPDNNLMFFSSNRTGTVQVWRMNPDGSNQTQITEKEGGFPLFVSPDNEWVYYHHGITRTLWRVSQKDKSEQIVLDKAKPYFAISPDGLQAAFSEKQGDERFLAIASLTDGKIVKTFPLADKKSLLLNLVWMPDGKNLAYISVTSQYENFVLWSQSLADEKPHQIVPLDNQEADEISALAIAPDGKNFAIVQRNWLHDAVLLKGFK